jgi:hypothetical protein
MQSPTRGAACIGSMMKGRKNNGNYVYGRDEVTEPTAHLKFSLPGRIIEISYKVQYAKAHNGELTAARDDKENVSVLEYENMMIDFLLNALVRLVDDGKFIPIDRDGLSHVPVKVQSGTVGAIRKTVSQY